MVRPQGVTLLAVWHLILGVLLLFGACMILVGAVPAVIYSRAEDAIGALAPLLALGFGSAVTLGLGAVSLAVGWGLLQMRSWARWVAIVLNAFSLVAFPVGTLIGGLILWYLFQPEVIRQFENARPA